jgi:hypothetical protein
MIQSELQSPTYLSFTYSFVTINIQKELSENL